MKYVLKCMLYSFLHYGLILNMLLVLCITVYCALNILTLLEATISPDSTAELSEGLSHIQNKIQLDHSCLLSLSSKKLQLSLYPRRSLCHHPVPENETVQDLDRFWSIFYTIDYHIDFMPVSSLPYTQKTLDDGMVLCDCTIKL